MSDTKKRTCDTCGKDLTKVKELYSCSVLEYDEETEEAILYRWFCSEKCAEEYIGHPMGQCLQQISVRDSSKI